MMKIVIDAGHGYNTPGKRTPTGEREWTFNDKVARAAIEHLNKFEEVQLLRVDDSTGKTDVPLKTRTDQANDWNADVYISIHHNALNNRWGSHGGIECYTMDHPNANPKSVEIAKLVQLKIVKALGLRNRGIKRANFHVLRETKMPAVLTEGGFMDSTVDIKVLRNDGKLQAQGIAIAEGVADFFALKMRIDNSESVSSTHADAWEWAEKEGYLNGENPLEPLTREQLATVLKRYNDRSKES